MRKLDVSVYKTATYIIITGRPDEGDETHHCDAMGCGREHVLYRFPLSNKNIIPIAWGVSEDGVPEDKDE